VVARAALRWPKGPPVGDDGTMARGTVASYTDFPIERLLQSKGAQRISVCLPARDEAATIGAIVGTIRRELMEAVPLVDEILVVDDGSTDPTAEEAARAGARVVDAESSLPGLAPGPGKGQALWKAVAECEGDLIVFCDADLLEFDGRFVTGLLGPLLEDERVALVKAFYERPLDGRPGEGGRVTELVARPLLALLFPQLAGVLQPLAGESAARRSVLERLPFVHGYGVDLGLLIDVAARHGAGSIAQVDLGVRRHRNRPLDELAGPSIAVMQVALHRAGVAVRPQATLLRPGAPPVVVRADECPPLVDVPAYRRRSA
jgi:glucosyl-3-phosphoglycerate synthase